MLKAIVIGHLGKDALVNNVSGKNVINFSVAHTEKWNDAQGQQQSRTTWVECAHWTEKTAVAAYLKKGTQVYVEGGIEASMYQAQDGTSKATLKLRVGVVQLLGSPTGTTAPAAPAAPAAQQVTPPPPPVWNGTTWVTQAAPAAATDDDLPF